MPEMPEVEVVRRGLHARVVGRRVRFAESLHARTLRRQPGGAAEFAALLSGRTVLGTGRRGKFLWLVSDDPGFMLAAHLGMSGQFRVSTSSAPRRASAAPGRPAGLPDPAKSVTRAVGSPEGSDPGAPHHARARLGLDGLDVWFVDQRTFGWLWAAPVTVDRYGLLVPLPVQDIARDPADPAFDPHAVARALHRHRVEVKRLLLAQTIVSGIGNIYADEALWRAGVHPTRRADRLPVRTLVGVLAAAGEVMGEALAAGGTSFDSLYVDVNGRSGYFDRGLAVYGRAGMPCRRCGTAIRRSAFMNRSSHFCPTCQPEPRGRG